MEHNVIGNSKIDFSPKYSKKEMYVLQIKFLMFSDDLVPINIESLGDNEKKQVFIQIGGNWCIWCARFNDFVTTDSNIDSVINKDYITYHLNYSKENYNKTLLAKYGYPQRFGFPVFLILNEADKKYLTQSKMYN